MSASSTLSYDPELDTNPMSSSWLYAPTLCDIPFPAQPSALVLLWSFSITAATKLGVAIRKSYRAHNIVGKKARWMRLEMMAEKGEVEWEKVGEEGEVIMREGDVVVMSSSERRKRGGSMGRVE